MDQQNKQTKKAKTGEQIKATYNQKDGKHPDRQNEERRSGKTNTREETKPFTQNLL